MKGRSPNKAEKQLHDRMARLGCIACRKEGVFNDYVSIHHIDGRTKPEAHKKVLPLCYPHHQGGGPVPAVHQNKAEFEQRYGRQMDLLNEVMAMLA